MLITVCFLFKRYGSIRLVHVTTGYQPYPPLHQIQQEETHEQKFPLLSRVYPLVADNLPTQFLLGEDNTKEIDGYVRLAERNDPVVDDKHHLTSLGVSITG